ncbi:MULTISPECIES: hypothetical protein [Rhodomicrobium]|nr:MULTISPECIES: hypothetical protein [Rhodomicrobium]
MDQKVATLIHEPCRVGGAWTGQSKEKLDFGVIGINEGRRLPGGLDR